MSINVQIRGSEQPIDINDNEQLLAACEVVAVATLKRIEPNNHTKALKELLRGLHYWHIKNGAQLYLAALGGHEGIGLDSALQAHNFIGSMIGEDEAALPEPVAPEEVLEGDDAPVLVDAQGRPVPPGQQSLLGSEGTEL